MVPERSGTERPEPPAAEVLSWISDGCALFDAELRCTYANAPAGALFDLNAEAVVGRRLRAELPAPAAALREAAEQVLATRVSRHLEVRDARGERWFDARLHATPDGILLLVRDVTEARRARTELAAHADYLQQLVDQLPAFLWIIDRDLVVRRIEGGRPMLEALDRDRLVGLPMEEVTRMGVETERDLAVSMDMHRRALRGIPGHYRATWKGIVLESRIRPLRDASGEILGIVGVGVDVTEQARMQERLREGEERFRAVVERGTELTSILDDDGRLVYATPSHVRVLGYAPEELRVTDVWSLIHPDDVALARSAYAELRPGASVGPTRPLRMRTKDGRWRSLSVTLTDLRQNPVVHGVVVNGRDVTEQLALEAQLRQAQKMEALGQLAGGVAHDFNNLLAAIAGYAQIIHQEVAADDPHREDLEEILKAVERAASVTRQLLAFSRRQALATERVDLVAVVQEMGRMLRPLLPPAIALRVSPPSGASPIWVLADRGQVEQIVMNLALNARDAMPDGGALTIAARAGASPEEEHAVVEVRDEGHGMSPDVQAHAFEPFFTTKAPGRGTGLGLATVYGIVRQYGGRVEIASAVGEGTTVTVVLPTADADAAPSERLTASAARGDAGGRVLVVDDVAQVRDVTARILARAGYDVETAVDAGEALRMLDEPGGFDLVLTDAAMPGMQGVQLAEEIARRHPGVQVILMSGYAELTQGEFRRPASPAVAAFVQKPFHVPQLLGEIRRALTGDPNGEAAGPPPIR